MPRPEISLIINTYQMPGHLELVLTSVARQTALDRIEIIVTDDGSTDGTAQIVADFARMLGRPVGFVTHAHEGFHLTRCRNDGARIASAPYLLFLDGDCLIPPDHVEQYLRARREGVVHFGYCCRLDEEVSQRVTKPAIIAGDFLRWAAKSELRKLAKLHYKSLFYQWLGHKTKPALKGGNIGIWRDDYERLNGFDENFHAWGCEDDDLSHRARSAGLRVASILGRTRTYHLWHPPASTRPPEKWSDGPNVAYLQRRGRLTCCVNGLHKRTVRDLRVRLAGVPSDGRLARQLMLLVFGRNVQSHDVAEMELLFHPGQGRFSKTIDCRVLVAADPAAVPAALRQEADVILPADIDRAPKLLAQWLGMVRMQDVPAHRVAA